MTKQNKKLILGFVIVFLVVGGFFAVVGLGKKTGIIPNSFLAPKQEVLGAKSKGYVNTAATSDDDGDGLVNLVEQQIGTNMNNSDTDGDGFTDGEEVGSGHDPLTRPDGTRVNSTTTSGQSTTNSTTSSDGTDDFSYDSDNDNLSDGQEKLLGTNVNKADTDGDGFTDGQEVATGHNPLKK